MISGHFYYITDEYYEKFPNCNLMGNKETDESGKHGRPCFYCFRLDDYYWMVPISSKIEKYERLYEAKIQKYPNYDGLRFGYVNGQYRAFLLQNLCPVTEKYIGDEYRIERKTVPVTIDSELQNEIISIIRKIVRLHKKGIKIVLTDLDAILKDL